LYEEKIAHLESCLAKTTTPEPSLIYEGDAETEPEPSLFSGAEYDNIFLESRPNTIVYVEKDSDVMCKRGVALGVEGHGPAKDIFDQCCSQACYASYRREMRANKTV